MPAYGSGSEQLAALGKRLKQAGAAGMRTELLQGLRAGAAPMVPAVKRAAEAKLPKAGGLNKQVAGQKITVSVRLSGKNAGVRLATTAPDTKETNSGYVRHPSPRNNRKKWRITKMPAAVGWWSDTLAEKGPSVTPELVAVMNRIARRIQGR